MMSFEQVTVFGGTGFVGSHIVRQLSEATIRIRVAVRHPGNRLSSTLDNVSEVYADVRDRSSVAGAMEGSQGAINAVSLYVERPDLTFDAVHLRGAQNVACEAKLAGLKSLVYLSGLGADLNSRSPYVRARAQGESIVQQSFSEATILRPSVIFGRGDSFFNNLSRITRVLPVLPLFGTGHTLLQPVFVEDVAAAAVHALADPKARGKVYELGGPQVYSYKTLVKMLIDHLNRKCVLFPMPFFIWEIQAMLLNILPNPPLTRDQVILMSRDNVVSDEALTLSDLGVKPNTVESQLADCLISKQISADSS